MDRALWFLLSLRIWGWLRRWLRSLQTAKGIVLAVVVVAFFIPWLMSMFMVPYHKLEPEHLQNVRRFGPLMLLGYCVFTLVTSAGEHAVSFTPAEVNLLFSGPFTRRQLLGYKIVGGFAAAVVFSAFISLFVRIHAGTWLSAYMGMLLALMFGQLFAMATVLIGTTVSAAAYNRRRKLVFLLLVVLVLVPLAQAGRQGLAMRPAALLDMVERSSVGQTVLTPFRWFILAFTAEAVWPDLAHWAGLALAADLALVLLVFALDAHYLETAAAAGERIYAMRQKVRTGSAISGMRGAGIVRWRLPSLPRWGGIGPIAWRQLLTGLRHCIPLLILLLLILGGTLVPFLATGPGLPQRGLAPVLGGTVFGMTIFLTPLITFDFRGDLDRFEVLKTLPIAEWRLSVGQLVAPVLFLSGIQWIVVAVIQGFLERANVFLLAGAAFALPFNFLLFAIDNLLFLWFPTRPVQSTPGDVQGMGRNILLTLARMAGLGVAAGAAALIGLITFALAEFLTGYGWIPALAAVWLALAGCGAALVPLMALAWRKFDVARDVPP